MNDNPESESSETPEPKGGRPGPVDHDGSGGMASRELAADEESDE